LKPPPVEIKVRAATSQSAEATTGWKVSATIIAACTVLRVLRLIILSIFLERLGALDLRVGD
jgi:hypothetical protein